MSERLTTSPSWPAGGAIRVTLRARLPRSACSSSCRFSFWSRAASISPAFLSAGNLSNLLLQIAPLAIVAIGQTFVMIVRGLDLSVASMMATAAVIATGFSGTDRDVAVIFAAACGRGSASACSTAFWSRSGRCRRSWRRSRP